MCSFIHIFGEGAISELCGLVSAFDSGCGWSS